jgi:hypothetical protein
MEAMFVAGALLHPVALLILALVLFAGVSIGGQSTSLAPRSPRWALARGLFAVFLVSLVIAAVSAYVSPEESKRLGVQPENYTTILRREFIVLAVLATYASLIGCCVVGIPLVTALASKGWATVPTVVFASVAISLLFCAAVGLLSLSEPTRALREAAFLTGLHALLALAFATGIGLSWRSPRRTNEA